MSEILQEFADGTDLCVETVRYDTDTFLGM